MPASIKRPPRPPCLAKNRHHAQHIDQNTHTIFDDRQSTDRSVIQPPQQRLFFAPIAVLAKQPPQRVTQAIMGNCIWHKVKLKAGILHPLAIFHIPHIPDCLINAAYSFIGRSPHPHIAARRIGCRVNKFHHVKLL